MLQGGEDLQAGAMQQHPDIGKRDIQEITDFLQLQALAFAQGQHAALQLGQTVEGLVQAIAQFALGEQGFRRILVPGVRRLAPVTVV